jgi:hypothetical protein
MKSMVKNFLLTRAKPNGGKACRDSVGAMRERFGELTSVFLCQKGGDGAQKNDGEEGKKNSSTCAQPNASKGKIFFERC